MYDITILKIGLKAALNKLLYIFNNHAKHSAFSMHCIPIRIET